MNKETYLTEYPKHESMRENVKKDKNRLHFHMMPPTGWMNDPNGLCEFQGVNHIYFQYTPFLAGWGTKLWGHYTTKDWIHYKEEEPFLYPDEEWDRDGVYSGSAYTCEDGIHYFYTGNVKLWDKDYDYIMNGREQNTIHVFSPDGKNIAYKKLVMTNDDYPVNMSKHVRDPKIYKKDSIRGGFITKGDANEVNDGGLVTYDSVVGKVMFDIPLLGYVSSFMSSLYGKCVVIGVLIVMMALEMLYNRMEKMNCKKVLQYRKGDMV